MSHWQVRIDWNRSLNWLVIMGARRCVGGKPGQWHFVAWDVARATAIGGDMSLKKKPDVLAELRSRASQAADILAGQTPTHPLAVAADDARRDLATWHRVEALHRKYKNIDLLLAEARRQARKSKSRAGSKK